MTLFDGTSLDGWRVLGDANWQLGDGIQSSAEVGVRIDRRMLVD